MSTTATTQTTRCVLCNCELWWSREARRACPGSMTGEHLNGVAARRMTADQIIAVARCLPGVA